METEEYILPIPRENDNFDVWISICTVKLAEAKFEDAEQRNQILGDMYDLINGVDGEDMDDEERLDKRACMNTVKKLLVDLASYGANMKNCQTLYNKGLLDHTRSQTNMR